MWDIWLGRLWERSSTGRNCRSRAFVLENIGVGGGGIHSKAWEKGKYCRFQLVVRLYDRAMHRKLKGYQNLFQRHSQVCVTEGIQEPSMRLCFAVQRQEQSRMAAGGGCSRSARRDGQGNIADSRVGVLCRWGTLFPPAAGGGLFDPPPGLYFGLGVHSFPRT